MEIHAIQTGTVEIKKNQLIGRGPRALRLVNVLLGKEWLEPVPIYVWVIEHNPNSEQRLKNKTTLSVN